MESPKKCSFENEIIDRDEGMALVRVKCKRAPDETYSKAIRSTSKQKAMTAGKTSTIRFLSWCQRKDSCLISEFCAGTTTAKGWYHDKK